MKRQEFEQIKENAEQFSYTSLAYTEYEEVSEYEVLAQNADVLLLGGENKEARSYEIHWAANTPEALIASVKQKKEGLITFIPKEWVAAMEASGFQIRNAWHDYFADELTAACEENTAAYEFLTPTECEQASEITQRCRNQNQGIARKLLKQAFAYGIEYGATKAFLAADEQNAGAIHLYQSMGFVASTEEAQIDMVWQVS